VICDHTSGSAPGYPTPAAQVADIDRAVGRLVAAISHSKDYKDSAVFVIEDDSQDGVDHIDGHRNVTLIASPYALRQTGLLVGRRRPARGQLALRLVRLPAANGSQGGAGNPCARPTTVTAMNVPGDAVAPADRSPQRMQPGHAQSCSRGSSVYAGLASVWRPSRTVTLPCRRSSDPACTPWICRRP